MHRHTHDLSIIIRWRWWWCWWCQAGWWWESTEAGSDSRTSFNSS